MIPRGNQGPIQRAFTGLLGFFDLKGAEVAPNSMRGDVQPIIDVRQFIAAGVLVSKEGTGTTAFTTATFIGATVPVRVPDGKVWVVQAATAFLDVPAVASCADMWISTRRAGALFTQAYRLSPAPNKRTVAGAPELAAAGFVGPLVLPAGWEFGIGLGGVTGGGGPYGFSLGVMASEFAA